VGSREVTLVMWIEDQILMAVRWKSFEAFWKLRKDFSHEGSLRFTIHTDCIHWIQNLSETLEHKIHWMLAAENFLLGVIGKTLVQSFIICIPYGFEPYNCVGLSRCIFYNFNPGRVWSVWRMEIK
jgi:hypothetical protein